MRPRNPTEQAWLLTLAGGAVALTAVCGLLEVLRRSANDVDAAVGRVWTAGKMLAQNTQAAHLLDATIVRTRTLGDELGVAGGASEERA